MQKFVCLHPRELKSSLLTLIRLLLLSNGNIFFRQDSNPGSPSQTRGPLRHGGASLASYGTLYSRTTLFHFPEPHTKLIANVTLLCQKLVNEQ